MSTLNSFVAVPYDITAKPIYFSDLADYTAKFDLHPQEEFDIQFIDGCPLAMWLSEVITLSQYNLPIYFDLLDDGLTEEIIIALQYKIQVEGCDINTAIQEYNDVQVYHGDAVSFVESFYQDTGRLDGIPEYITNYIDYEAIANDWLCGGDIIELDDYIIVR